MKSKLLKLILFIVLFCSGMDMAHAQIGEKQLKPFIPKGYTLADASGNGLKQPSGDILLELLSDELDDFETLILLHNEKGKLSKVAENANLLVIKDMLGVSGGNYPSLLGAVISIDYSLGSGSALSDISIKFEKSKDGQYYFKEYTIRTQNYGVEDLFARASITAAQTGKISFSEATEKGVLEKGKASSVNAGEPLYKVSTRFKKYIPDGFQLANFAEGDLNLDGFKNDCVLVVYNEDNCRVQLLLQQSNGGYEVVQTNNLLVAKDNAFNINNLKAVIKNGFFTIEQRIATSEEEFDHRYITFRYDVSQKVWFLHRFDAKHFSGFNTKPSKEVTHLTTKEFGRISFLEMNNLPGIYKYEPALSVVEGTLFKKQFYGRPNYGETPDKDEKIWVYLLKPDFQVNVFSEPNPADPETADKTTRNISEIQIYSTNQNIDFKNFEGKKIKLKGVFQSAQTGHQFTKVLMKVETIMQ